MPTHVHHDRVPFPREQVFAWHERPGALVRLTPRLMGVVLGEASDGIRDGSLQRLRVDLPGLPALPGPAARLGWPWLARHLGYDPPRAFEDVMVTGPFASWHHRHRFEDDGRGGTEVIDEISYTLPGGARAGRLLTPVIEARLARVFAYRTRQLIGDLAFHGAHPQRRTIAVSGASGLVGTQLVALLTSGGHAVRRLVRHLDPSPGEISWDPAAGVLDPEALRDVDAVIHLAGEPIGSRFTTQHKRKVLDSRVASTGLLARTLAALASDGRARALVVASGAGYYGAHAGERLLTEDSPPGEDFVAQVCVAWEAAADPARDAGIRVAHVRTGFVQTPFGGQLALQLPIYRVGLGGRLGDGRQWMSWITLDDLVALYAHVALTERAPGVDPDAPDAASSVLAGPINACAPQPVRAGEYAATLARVLRRPALLPVPSIGPRVLLGREGADLLALAGQRMSADRALAWGYRFRHENLAGGLAHVLALPS